MVVLLLYYKTLDNKQLPCLSISKVEVFLLQKKKKNQPQNPDILIISNFHQFPTSSLIIIHINLPPSFNEMQKASMCSFPKHKVAQYIFKQSLRISLQFSTNQRLL